MAPSIQEPSDVDQGIVLYDGECGACQSLANWASRRNAQGRLQIHPYQRIDLGKLSPDLNQSMASEGLVFLDARGEKLHGARATIETLRRLPGFWGMVGRVLSFPPLRALAVPFYRLFARHRGAISSALGLEPGENSPRVSIDASHQKGTKASS
jgi:predicted DCC family thiol-disulfide oxidoreductase YuxK